MDESGEPRVKRAGTLETLGYPEAESKAERGSRRGKRYKTCTEGERINMVPSDRCPRLHQPD